MTMRSLSGMVCGVLAGLLMQQAAATELSVLSAGAIEPGVSKAIAAFQKETGQKVRLQFNTAPQIRKRIAQGEAWDVIIAPPALLDELSSSARLGEERTPVGRVGLGVVVRPDAPVPDITSVETLKQALLQSESLVFNRASTGIYFEG
jgi:molybdate transport system substrate-binding protein